VIVPDLSYSLNTFISRGIRTAARLRNGKSVFRDFHNDVNQELEYLDWLAAEKLDAALIYPSLENLAQPTLAKLVLSGYPLVFIDRHPPYIPCWSISSDDKEIGRLAARHLVECGAKIPACVIADLPNLHDRKAGFQEQLNDLGVALPQSRIMYTNNHTDAGSTRDITQKLMEMIPRPDGIFFLNDYHALIGLRKLHDMGVRVPSEVKVIGCDDTEAAQYSLPTLSSIRQNGLSLGSEAFRLLCEMLEAPLEDRMRPRHVTIPVDLIPRETTGATGKTTNKTF
jgi:DNA-binding LacI/PurR family transcriptional regulator